MSFSRSSLLLVAALSFFATACDKGGLYPLFAPIDVLVPCGPNATTWLRSTAEGTEILVLGSLDPTTVPGPMESRCYEHALILHDSTTRYESGIYSVTSAGSGLANIGAGFRFDYDPSKPILSRIGARRDPIVDPIAVPIELAMNGAKLVATVENVDGVTTTGTYTNIYDVAAAIDTTSAAGALDAFTLANLAIFTGNVRMTGFGGAGMTAYTNKTQFRAAIDADPEAITSFFTVYVKSAFTMPDTDIEYVQFEDLSGLVINGVQTTIVNLMGDGGMVGVLDVSFRSGPNATDVAFTGSIDYDPVTIDNGVAGGGHYVWSFISENAASYDIDFSYGANLDLRHVLPVE